MTNLMLHLSISGTETVYMQISFSCCVLDIKNKQIRLGFIFLFFFVILPTVKFMYENDISLKLKVFLLYSGVTDLGIVCACQDKLNLIDKSIIFFKIFFTYFESVHNVFLSLIFYLAFI